MSVQLLKSRSWLFLFPFFSAGISFALVSIFYRRSAYGLVPGGSVFTTLYEFPADELRGWVRESGIPVEPIVWALLFLVSLLIIFFNTALVYSVLDVLRGEKAAFFTEWRKTAAKGSRLLIWVFIFALAEGAIIPLRSFNGVFLGNVNLGETEALILKIILTTAAWFFLMFWNFLTYFIIPVLIFEGIDLRNFFKRSFQLFTRTWKEQLIFRLLFLTVFETVFWVAVLFLLKACGFGFPDPNPLHRFVSLSIVATFIALTGWLDVTFSAVLYSYAITGMSPKEFGAYPAKGMVKATS